MWGVIKLLNKGVICVVYNVTQVSHRCALYQEPKQNTHDINSTHSSIRFFFKKDKQSCLCGANPIFTPQKLMYKKPTQQRDSIKKDLTGLTPKACSLYLDNYQFMM